MYNGEQLYAIRPKGGNFSSGHHYSAGVKLYRLSDAKRVVAKHNNRRVYNPAKKTIEYVVHDDYDIVPVTLVFGDPL